METALMKTLLQNCRTLPPGRDYMSSPLSLPSPNTRSSINTPQEDRTRKIYAYSGTLEKRYSNRSKAAPFRRPFSLCPAAALTRHMEALE